VAEVLAQFDDPLVSDGVAYRVQVCGAQMSDGLWEGWLEFIPVGGGKALRSPRETTQPNRTDTAYWAGALTPVYCEGAFRRALNPIVRKQVERPAAIFDEPAPDLVTEEAGRPLVQAVLDPFSVYDKSETLLLQELGALSAWHLVNIIRAYRLSAKPDTTLNRLPASALIEMIVLSVREQRLAG